ncbi:ABC transporter ATP-binding protein [Herbaspirillum sp. HC18]|nr:ABC transporter ATP-binding protein [Herbaspirillum sp. HC18]
MKNNSDAIVRIEQVTKVYQKDGVEVNALRGIDLKIMRGEFVALVGPSGLGKTTLLNLIGGLDTASGGRVWVGEEEIGSLSKSSLSDLRLRKIGFVFQEYNLIPVLSALENVEYVMLLQGVPEAERRARSLAVLADMGLKGMENRRPSEMSGGQQQRVAVARAIVSEPLIVLPDEPTANLDSVAGAALLDLMRELNKKKGITFVFFTHDPMVIQRAKRIIHLHDGRVVE